jgi:hypothetical protein
MTVKKKRSNAGRPTVITAEVIRKLEYVFGIGGSDREACFFAGISETALYEYQNKNPKFAEHKEALKENPILKARETIFKNLKNPQTAAWYLERKRKDEFSTRQEVEHNINTELDEMREDLNSAIKYVKTRPATDNTGGASIINSPA